jgi:hypothetical protein
MLVIDMASFRAHAWRLSNLLAFFLLPPMYSCTSIECIAPTVPSITIPAFGNLSASRSGVVPGHGPEPCAPNCRGGFLVRLLAGHPAFNLEGFRVFPVVNLIVFASLPAGICYLLFLHFLTLYFTFF